MMAGRDADDLYPYGARVPDNDELVARTAQLWSEAEAAQVALNLALDARDDAVRELHAAGMSDSRIAKDVDARVGDGAATAGNVRIIRSKVPLPRPGTVDQLRATRRR